MTKKPRIAIAVWHGEGQSFFHLVDRTRLDDDQPAIFATYVTRAQAEAERRRIGESVGCWECGYTGYLALVTNSEPPVQIRRCSHCNTFESEVNVAIALTRDLSNGVPWSHDQIKKLHPQQGEQQ